MKVSFIALALMGTLFAEPQQHSKDINVQDMVNKYEKNIITVDFGMGVVKIPTGGPQKRRDAPVAQKTPQKPNAIQVSIKGADAEGVVRLQGDKLLPKNGDQSQARQILSVTDDQGRPVADKIGYIQSGKSGNVTYMYPDGRTEHARLGPDTSGGQGC